MSDLPRSEDFLTVEQEFRSAAVKVQLGRCHLLEPFDDMLRTADGYRLDLSLSGRPNNSRANYCDRWSTHRFEPVGKLYLLRKDERVRARSDPGTGSSIICHLNPETIRSWFEDKLEWTDPRLESSLDINCTPIQALMMRMGNELQNPGFAHELLLDSLAVQLAVELRRYCTTIHPESDSGGLAPWRLKRIDERLEVPGFAPTLVELADLCNLSVRQLTRAFRISRGSSIGDYVSAKRIEQAKRMLLEGQNIKSVSGDMGFSSPSAFTVSFRKTTGTTPRQFRDNFYRSRSGK